MQLSCFFILSLTGKEPLPVKRLRRFIPAEELFQEMSGDTLLRPSNPKPILGV
jgi:hypothetical protein